MTYTITSTTNIYLNINSDFLPDYDPSLYILPNNETPIFGFGCSGSTFVNCPQWVEPDVIDWTIYDIPTGRPWKGVSQPGGIYNTKKYWGVWNEDYSVTDSWVYYDTTTTVWKNSSTLGGGTVYGTLDSLSSERPVSGPSNEWQVLSNSGRVILESQPKYPVYSNGLILYLDANINTSWSGSGVNWNDITNDNNNSTFYQALSPTTPIYSPSIGGSFSFNGSNQKFNIPTSPTLSAITDTVSVEVWLRPTLFDNREILCKSSNLGYRMRLDTTGHLWMLGANGVSYNEYTSSGTTTLNEWCQVVAVWTSSGYYTYINGVDSGYDPSYTLNVQLLSQSIDIGCFTGNAPEYHYQGDMSIVRMYNRVLTPEEVLSNYNSDKIRFGL